MKYITSDDKSDAMKKLKIPPRSKPYYEWTEDELTKPYPVTTDELRLRDLVQELEEKLKRQRRLKRNVDKRLREANKKLKQIEEAVHQARTQAVLNPVLVAPQRKVKV